MQHPRQGPQGLIPDLGFCGPPPPPSRPHRVLSALRFHSPGPPGPCSFWAQNRWRGREGHEVWATGVSHCQSPLPHSPRGLQEADLEWTTVKQSFQTEVQQLSR